MQPSVSLIVPVYNAQDTLCRCVDSVLHQRYTDFELLIIDDGSTDNSPALCDQYATDPRVRVFHQKNAGVSAARNLALSKAQGQYIQFLDSDDWITPDATLMLLRTAETHSADLVISDFYRVIGERVSIKGDIEEEGVMSREEYASRMMDNPADFYYGVLWNKLYRREIIQKHHLQMDEEINWCEDFLFNLEYIRYAQRFCALNIPIYYYVKTKGSLVSQANLSKTIRTKLTTFEYYNRLYQEVFDEETYEKHRLKVYRFLVDAAKDGGVLPPPLPGVKKLGEERVQLTSEALAENGIMADAYRDRKLLERCLEPVALQYELSLPEALLLLALGKDGFSGNRQELSALAGLSRTATLKALQQLRSKDFIQNEKKQILVLPPAWPVLSALESTIQDWKALRYGDFTEEEIEQYRALQRRVRQNVRNALR
ncbi:MAG: glycosyltransferase family 2 protein [Lachnospiraceae bacterium]|nr:glycosyltransferase family 2 protein [Lachnospiraceae bacterium]